MSEKKITEPATEVEAPLRTFRDAYDTLFLLIEQVPPDKREASGACGVWSPKQILQHLSGWLVEAEARYKAYETNVNTPGVEYDIDTFNAQSVESRQQMTWQETIDELRNCVHRLGNHAEIAMQNNTEVHRGVGGWLKIMGEDCMAHTVQIRDFILQPDAS